ncbi:MAG: hypothetical protein EOO75_19655 [Myxococcales bacterium]|nr:MAG: hypothetical protein EOO75_19655 [Myxococcales bacterium]
MWVGNPHDGGALRAVLLEVVDRAVEEHRQGFGRHILVELHDDGAVAVTDEGRGMPTEVRDGRPMAEQIMASWRAERVDGNRYPSGPCVASTLSERCRLETWSEGQAWEQTYERGVPVTPFAAVDATTRTGTRITYWPDLTIFTTVTRLTPAMIQPRLREIAALCPGLRIELRHAGETVVEHRPTGISSLVAEACPGGLLPTVARFTGEDMALPPVGHFIGGPPPRGTGGPIRVEVALQWRAAVPPEVDEARAHEDDLDEDTRPGSVYLLNEHRFHSGTPVRGLHAGLLQAVRRLARERGLLPRRGWTELAATITRRAVVAMRLEHPCPTFGTRCRDTPVNPDAGALLRQLTAARVYARLVEHPDALARLLAPGG